MPYDKHLALLIYLVLAVPRGFHRRDRLVGLFWPEHEQANARANLRKAVHFLRRDLGDGILDVRGDEELGVAPGAISCDAIEFESAVANGHYARALELYKGNGLLSGFYITDAPEFERWVETDRSRLQDAAVTAAWQLVRRYESESNPTEARHWARTAAKLAPLDERGIQKLLALLDRIGDRAGALRTYEEFERRLREEFDAQPAPETQALVRAIKSRQSQYS